MRAYAPFFEWFDKGRKELGVVEELLESLNREGRGYFHSPRLQIPDPPDCVCVNRSGAQVALEVAEVVCRDAARLNAQGHDVMRLWNPGELTVHINHRLGEKDKKTYHGGPYAETVACLFTDEPMLTVAQAASELSVQRFGPFGQLTSGFLVFSHDPGTKSYPVIELSFNNDV